MSGGQHRNDEGNGPSRSGEREAESSTNLESVNPALLRKPTGVRGKNKN